MAVAPGEIAASPLTYEEYLAEGEVMARYDILDGVRHLMPNPTRRHQRILLNVARALQDYEEASGRGQCLVAPQDVLITRVPLRTRQPDVLFISHGQLAKCAPETDPTPIQAAPELVVEILSPSETRRARDQKIADYCSVDVRECWVVSPAAGTIEVLRLTQKGAETAAVYSEWDTVPSIVFPDLLVPVAQVLCR